MAPDTPEVSVTVGAPEPEAVPEPAVTEEVAASAQAVVVAAQAAVALAEGQAALAEQDAANRIVEHAETERRQDEDIRWLRATMETQSSAISEMSSQVQNLLSLVSQLTTPQAEEPPAEVQEIVQPVSEGTEVLAVVEENPEAKTLAKRRRVI